MRPLSALWVLALLAAGLPLAAGAQALSSQRDYTDPAQRDLPIACGDGDIEGFPGQTLGQVFGDQWPAHPAPVDASAAVRAQMVTAVRSQAALKGLPAQPGLVVFAVLVDASGAPLRAEVLCATAAGYGKAARRIAMQSKYRPAVVDGNPVTSVVVHVQRFSGGGT